MKISPRIKRQLRIQHSIFLLLLTIIVAALAWLSTRFDHHSDWTQNLRNTPSQATLGVLEAAKGDLSILAFVSEGNRNLKSQINTQVERFQRHKSDLQLIFVDPFSNPEEARKHNVNSEGETIVAYQDRTEKLGYLDEQSLTNAIQRLIRNKKSWISFVEGHGERSPFEQGNYEYSTLRQQLENKGFNVRSINFAEKPEVPADTSLLVIADPQNAMLSGETQIIQDFIDAGNNVLWLSEPRALNRPDELSEQLGLDFMPGMIIDLNTQLLGISDPRFVMIPEYPAHPITRNFQTLSLFPTAGGIEYIETEDWDVSVILETLPRSWVETEELNSNEELTMDAGIDIPGPVALGLAITRIMAGEFEAGDTLTDNLGASELDVDEAEANSDQQQRIIVIGDADFVADAYIGQAGNLDLAINIFNWLTKDDDFLNIPARTLVDQQLNLSNSSQLFIAIVFLLIIPLGLIISGVTIWLRRRRN